MVPWAKGFVPPSRQVARAAVGTFPGSRYAATGADEIRSVGGTTCEAPRAGRSWDDGECFVGAGGSGWPPRAVPAPTDEADWLAADVEEGQTFNEYVSLCCTRSGRLKANRVPRGKTEILFLPITLGSAVDPAMPPLEELASFASAYFGGARVRVLESAKVALEDASAGRVGAFASRSKGKIKLPAALGGGEGALSLRRGARGRVSLHVDPLLGELARGLERSGLSTCFALVGVCTEIDLHSHPTDLFVAGMAAGGSGVACFSFSRYHPHLRMSPEHWDDYGYAAKAASDVYYPDSKAARRRLALGDDVPSYDSLSGASKRLFKLRAAKLLTHEILHLYGVDHCVNYRCLMQGTGHLREDFAAPVHLCPVDLRKLAWRNQFDVQRRHVALAAVLGSWGCAGDRDFYLARARALDAAIDLTADARSDDDVIDLTSPSPPAARRKRRRSPSPAAGA